jgi:4-amino-4-deoxy-L-arabinose transferase-like glycosyltransferase
VLAPLVMLVATGLWGIDFGYHWDEVFHHNGVARSIDRRLPLPGWYIYPQVSYWLNLVATLPDFLAARASHGVAFAAAVKTLVYGHGHELRVRAIFLGVSSLSVVWVYLAARAWGRRWTEALIAASLLGLSFQVGYHLRWIAPDGIVMQFGALTLLAVSLAQAEPSRRAWRLLGGVAAGLACGTKYPGGMLLVPVLIASAGAASAREAPARVAGRLLETAAVFALAFVVSTPGALFDREIFFSHLHYISGYYQGSHYGHTVARGGEHLQRNLRYLALSLFSHYRVVAAAFSLFVLPGAVLLWRESRFRALLFLSFPVPYLLFMSAQRVMVVRNLLVLTPFLALLSARGIAWLLERRLPVAARAALALALGGAMLLDGAWLIRAADTVHHRRDSRRFALEVADYLAAHPATRFFVSPRVAAALASVAAVRPNATTDASAGAEMALFYAYRDEGMDNNAWPANTPGLATRTFGPQEIDFDYYPSWLGNDRILLMPFAQAKRLGVRVLLAAPPPSKR